MNSATQLGHPSSESCGLDCNTTWGDTGMAADRMTAGTRSGYASQGGKMYTVGSGYVTADTGAPDGTR